MAKLSAWVKKHLSSKSRPKEKSTHDKEPPFLPSSRRPITPSSFDTSTCFLFQLPYEIRSMILLLAFGGRSIHMHIVREGEAWEWRGAVCYRNEREFPTPVAKRHGWCATWQDSCMQRLYQRERKFPEECNVGIMGFLLSCRQGYAEGIDVLYSANTIIIQSEPLLLHLPQLIPPNRLAAITSLEMVITAHRIDKDDRGSFDLDHMKPILDNIVTHCHHLRRFYLSISVNWFSDVISDGPVLPLLDAFCRSMQLRNMRVDLPDPSYWPTLDSEPMENDHPREAPTTDTLERSLWRSLDGDKPVVQHRVIERYPYPPLKTPVLDGGEESAESSGYWLARGDPGTHHLNFVTCH